MNPYLLPPRQVFSALMQMERCRVDCGKADLDRGWGWPCGKLGEVPELPTALAVLRHTPWQGFKMFCLFQKLTVELIL